MPLIPVLKFDRKAAMNPGRPVNALLKAQVHHLHEAERNLPSVTGLTSTSTPSKPKAKPPNTFAR